MTSNLDQGPPPNERPAESANTAEIPESPGARLRQTRQGKKLNLDYVASALHLSRPVVEAIEHDDYDRLPSAVFVAGYIRSYARLLGLDPEPLNQSFRRLHPGAEPPPRQVGRLQPGEEAPEGGNWLLYLVILAVLLVLGGGVYLWWTQHPLLANLLAEKTAPPSAPTTPTSPANSDREDGDAQPLERGAALERAVSDEDTPQVTSSDVASPPQASDDLLSTAQEDATNATPPDALDTTDALASERAATETALDSAPPPASDSRPLPTPPPPDRTLAADTPSLEQAPDAAAAAPTEANTADEPAETPADETEAASTASTETVELEFTGPCWVDIRDATGEVLLFGEMSRGDRESLDGEPPYSLVLGNASAVEIRISGEPYDLRTHARGNVARFELDPTTIQTE